MGCKSQKMLNISIINHASYIYNANSMICPACFTTPDYVTFHLIKTKKQAKLIDSATKGRLSSSSVGIWLASTAADKRYN